MILAAVLGVVLILIVLGDAFETIVLPRRVTRPISLARLFYQCTWYVWSGAVRSIFSSKRQETFLSWYGPLSLLLLLILWATCLIIGFGLVHWASGSIIRSQFGINFGTYLYLSSTTFYTLGLGEVVPCTTFGKGIIALEAGIQGFGFLALVSGAAWRTTRSCARRRWRRRGEPPGGARTDRRGGRGHRGAAAGAARARRGRRRRCAAHRRLDASRDRTLELALRTLVEERIALELGYLEQLYTFGNRYRDPRERAGGPRVVSVAYLALVREGPLPGACAAAWRAWYDFLPWQYWRAGLAFTIFAMIALLVLSRVRNIALLDQKARRQACRRRRRTSSSLIGGRSETAALASAWATLRMPGMTVLTAGWSSAFAGVDKEFNGEAILSPGYAVGFVEQEPQLDSSKTVKEIVEEGVQKIVDLLNEFNRISERFSEPMTDDEMNKLIERQGEVQVKMDTLNAWDLDSRLEMAMDALRCPPGDTPVKILSGGERRRVALCRLLLQQPDILLLDEPTNHLDAESVAWMEQHLKRYEGTVIAVTHDRYFLDNVAEWILELDRGEGIPWKGNYSSWLEQKRARLQREEKSESKRQMTRLPLRHSARCL